MDNITHSLVGAAMAEVALRDRAAPVERRLFFAAGIVASNLPDADLLFTGLTPPPLGYLLHHRGHTHTLMGLLAEGLVAWMVSRLVPAVRRLAAPDRARLLVLIAVGLCGHLLLDAGNDYGVHPFAPLDARWYYGDAVFIFEPWLWLFLGLSVVWNARDRLTRGATALAVVVLPLVLAYAGVVPGRALAALALAGAAGAWGMRGLSPRGRGALALAASTVFIAALYGLSFRVRAETTARVAPSVRGELVDVVRYPHPAWPVCWAAIAIEKDERAGEFVLRPATVSLLPWWQPASRCASRSLSPLGPLRSSEDGRVAWQADLHQSLPALRDLAARDCWVRAWLQFSRAPFVRAGEIRDLRFETPAGGNFTALRLRPPSEAAECPPHLTHWAMPRADLLDPAR